MTDTREFALSKHGSQMYGDGHPYIEHLDRVAAHFPASGLLWHVAILHDILEDTECTHLEIAETFSPEVAHIVELVTKRPNVSGDEYYKRIKENAHARQVKLADLSDNLAHCLINIQEGVPNRPRSSWTDMANRYAKRVHYLATLTS